MRIDWGTLAGLILAFGGIAAGLMLEGGSLYEILQPTAALIVLGGTFGATLVAQPLPVVWAACRQLLVVFAEPRFQPETAIEEIIELANQARRHGIISLEKKMENTSNPFLYKAMALAVDGTDPKDLRGILENEIDQDLARREAEAQVFESAGGFAPTIGIIGAVLGLIQVMKHLDDISEVGKGIAVAFVATIYGVGIANLVLLPGAKKIIARARQVETGKYLMLEGTVSLAEGLNPRLIRSRLEAFVESTNPSSLEES